MRLARRVVGVGLLLGACAAPLAPRPAARLGVASESFVDDGPFRVVFAGPSGDVTEAQDLTIALSRPIRAPGVLVEGVPAATVRRVHDGATVPGAWRWFGERTAVFWPTNGFELATEFEVTVDAALRAFDGSPLTPAASFRFTTPRPRLEEARYEWDEQANTHTIGVDFNQEVTREVVQAALHIEGRGTNGIVTVPFNVAPAEEAESARFELLVDRSIVSLSDVVVVAAASLQSTAGPLASGREARVPLPELGPLRVSIACNEQNEDEETIPAPAVTCALDRSNVTLTLSKPVRGTDLRRFLVLPAPHQKLDLNEDATSDVWLGDALSLLPGKRYRIVVRAGLVATDGDRLATDQVLQFTTADSTPYVSWRDVGGAAGDFVVEAARRDLKLRLDTLNVPSLEVVRAPLGERQLLQLLSAGTRSAADVRALPGAWATARTINGKRNVSTTTRYDLAQSHERGQAGSFAVATSAPGFGDDVRIASVTDLGLTTKWSAYGGLVWVTRLSNGAAVPNAPVSIRQRDAEVFATSTSQDGVAVIPPEVAQRLERAVPEPVVLARSGTDLAFARLPVQRVGRAQPVSLLFPDRRLYRPGETVSVKGIFRLPGPRGLAPPVGKSVRLEACDRDERVLFTTTAVLDAFGTFASQVPIPRDVRLGHALLRARLGDEAAPRWDATARFSVDEFRAPEMQIEASAVQSEYVAGANAALSLRGRYLLGAPLHDAVVELRALRSPAHFVPPALSGFTIGAERYWSRHASSSVFEGNATLDKDGLARPEVPLQLPEQVGPEMVTVSASVDDVSKAFGVEDDVSVLVHPSDIYVGLRLTGTTPRLGRPFRVETAAAGWSGPVKVGVPVHIELLKSNGDTTALSSCEVTTSVKVAGCELTALVVGSYWLTARAQDAAGRPARAALSIDVQVGAPEVVVPAPVERAEKVEEPQSFEQACAEPERTGYSGALLVKGSRWDQPFLVGEHIRTCLRGAGLSLFTQEREGVLGYEALQLSGPGTVHDVTATALHHPNFSLGLHTVVGRSKPFPRRGGDSGHPFARDADAEVTVARPPESELRVAIDTGTEHRPGEAFEARVLVKDGHGRPAQAQVTLWAVDEGVVLLEPFQVPHASDAFAEDRWSALITSDTRDMLLWDREGSWHTTRAPKVRMGATMTSSRAHIGRTVFRPTAWFLPSILTGPDGVAKARVKLPDNVTTWRVFAVAADTAQAFGEAETSFVANKPLLARPALPRFLRAGDVFDAAVIIDSLRKEPLNVNVQLQASGALTGQGERALQVPPNGHVPLRFPVTTRGRGNATVRFRVTGSHGLADDVTIAENVVVPTTLEAQVLSGQTRSRRDEPLGDLSRARKDVGGLEYRIASTPLVGLAESLQSLIDYPYGCTEQLSSRLVPLLRLQGLAKELGVALPADVDGVARGSVTALLGHQQRDGGFGFWRESSRSEAWLTVSALSALLEARRAGISVPQAALDKATDWLEKQENRDAPASAWLEALHVSQGQPRPEKLRALAAEPDLPLFARALLAHALAKVDGALAKQQLDSVLAQIQLAGASATVRESAVWSRTHLSSSARTTALTLRALVTIQPQSPWLPKLVQGLLGLRRDGRWATTQETGWALMALDDVQRVSTHNMNPTAAASLSFNGTQLAKLRGLEVKTGTIPMATLQATPNALLSFETQGAPLFYEATLRYARTEAPSTPLEHGIHVARAFKPLLAAKSLPFLHVGDSVDVEVVLGTATARDLVVLDDPIPAGFEAVKEEFAVSSDDDLATRVPYTHRELRDDRVVTFFDQLPAGLTHIRYRLRVIAAGRFSQPPAKAECMYAPDVFGRTAASTVETL